LLFLHFPHSLCKYRHDILFFPFAPSLLLFLAFFPRDSPFALLQTDEKPFI